jgi:ferrous iron transport protein A
MNSTLTLSGLKKGQRAVVKGFSSEGLPAKVYDMGLLPGAEIEFKSALPFNGPMCICLAKNKCQLALGKKEADCVFIELLSESN